MKAIFIQWRRVSWESVNADLADHTNGSQAGETLNRGITATSRVALRPLPCCLKDKLRLDELEHLVR